VAVQLLGVGEGALHRFLAAAVDGLAPGGVAVGVVALAGILPDMAGGGTRRCRPSLRS
jgi:hypothetical protein